MERLLFIGLGFLLALFGGAYWLIAWCLLMGGYGFTLLSKKKEWKEMIPFRFLSISGVILLLWMIKRTFLVDYYFIPSESMAPRLLPGDRVLVSKLAYGPRLPNTFLEVPMLNIFHKILIKKKKNYTPNIKKYQRLNENFTKLQHNDLIVFNHPKNQEVNIKRCVGLPGDTLEFKFDQLFRNQRMINEKHAYFAPLEADPSAVFSKDRATPKRSGNIPSFVIPAKGLSIPLNIKNFLQYEAIINIFEGRTIFVKRGQVFIDGQAVEQYTFTHNYCYLLGDNRNNSADSRHWGFLPQALIIGKAKCILYSDRSEEGFLSRCLMPL